MVTRFEKILPAEQWQQIFESVLPGDLCKVVTTSQYMNRLASWQKLWTDMRVNVRKVRDDGLAEFYAIDRFKSVMKMDFSNVKFTSEQLEKLFKEMDGSPLRDIDFGFSNNDFGEVPGDLLARAVGQLQTFCFNGNRQLTTVQCVKLLEVIMSSTTLANITLTSQSFDEVPAQLLASAVTRLQSVNFSEGYITTDQCIKMLEASLSSTTLAKLNLTMVDLSDVPTQLLVQALCRLKTIKLSCSYMNGCLTDEQVLHLLKGMATSSTLVNVDLEGTDLSEIPARVLTKAICRLQKANLSGTDLTTYQSIGLLKGTLTSETLTKLNLSLVDLSEVPSDLLSRAICRLSAASLGVDMFGEHYMTFLQCVQILESIPTSSTLVKLSLIGVDLTEVSDEVLTNAVKGLQTVKLNWTNLTTEQCVALLETELASKTMARVYLPGVNLSEVPAELLVRAVCQLKTLHLSCTQLTTDQCVQLVDAIISSGTSCKTYLHGNQITEKVPAQGLASLPPHVSGEHNH